MVATMATAVAARAPDPPAPAGSADDDDNARVRVAALEERLARLEATLAAVAAKTPGIEASAAPTAGDDEQQATPASETAASWPTAQLLRRLAAWQYPVARRQLARLARWAALQTAAQLAGFLYVRRLRRWAVRAAAVAARRLRTHELLLDARVVAGAGARPHMVARAALRGAVAAFDLLLRLLS
ncbi:hypothetical protein HK405_002748 [Cladochytrium tenue]|nr:hypothetical protein HK405_002748 [Cladochytrium tenue]